MPFSSCASTRQVSNSLMRRRVAEREDEPDAVDIWRQSVGGWLGGANTHCLPKFEEIRPAQKRAGAEYGTHPDVRWRELRIISSVG